MISIQYKEYGLQRHTANDGLASLGHVLVFIRSNVGIESWGMNELSFVFCLCRRLWELRWTDPLSKESCHKSTNKIHKRGSRVVLSYSAIDTCRWTWDRTTRTGGIMSYFVVLTYLAGVYHEILIGI
jgi:hypothetical protein